MKYSAELYKTVEDCRLFHNFVPFLKKVMFLKLIQLGFNSILFKMCLMYVSCFTHRCMQMGPTCARACGGNHLRSANPPASACKWTRRTWWQSSISSLKAQRKAPVSAAVRSIPAKRDSWSLRHCSKKKGKRRDEFWWVNVRRREIIVEVGLRASQQPVLSLTSENSINQWLAILILLWVFLHLHHKAPRQVSTGVTLWLESEAWR